MAISYYDASGEFCSTRTTVADAPELARQWAHGDVYFQANPTRPLQSGRGKEADVVGLRALTADLDFAKCGGPEGAEKVLSVASGLLGSRPAVVVESGHGWHPHWRLAPLDWDYGDVASQARARALVERFVGLVQREAQALGWQVDSTVDLARVWRVPGTANTKTEPPVQVVAQFYPDAVALDVAHVSAVLEVEGIVAPAPRERHRDTSPLRPANQGVHPYAAVSVERELARLDDCDVLGWSVEWDNTHFAVACNLVEFGNSNWSGYSLEQAEEDFLARAAADADFGPREHEQKWASAESHIGDGARADPNGSPADDFGVLVPEVEAQLGEHASRFVDGGTFVLDAPDRVPALWGRDGDVLWAEGEALMIAGGSGVGKTTLGGQVVLARIVGGDVLGYPVEPCRRVLYLAMDRPKQIARALRRTMRHVDRQVLADKLVFWPGPPPADIAKNPKLLLELARQANADTVVVDSLKDAAIGLSEDVVGAGYNSARQLALANGVEVMELHHLIKKGVNGLAPKALADVYGSAWLTNGLGSVVLLHGKAGDVMVKFMHLKQPENVVGPFTVLHDHDAGTSSVLDQVDLSAAAVVAVAVGAGAKGTTVRDAALALCGPEVTKTEEQSLRRRLDKLTKDGLVQRPVESDKRTNTAARYRGITHTITRGLAS